MTAAHRRRTGETDGPLTRPLRLAGGGDDGPAAPRPLRSALVYSLDSGRTWLRMDWTTGKVTETTHVPNFGTANPDTGEWIDRDYPLAAPPKLRRW